MTVWPLVFYRTPSGRSPVEEYISGLDFRERAKVTFDLQLLATYGLDLKAPHVRSIDGKLWELRVTGQVQHRILYFAVSGQRFVLLHAFTKKTQKAPSSDIERAKARMANYLERVGA